MITIRSVPVLLALLSVACGGDPRDYFVKGNQLFTGGKYNDAALNYKKAIQKDPEFGEAYYRLGLAEIQLGEPIAAYQTLSRAVELLPARDDIKVALADFSLTTFLNDSAHPKALRDKVVVLT
jgi:tetratricopeptide (TPR) repeat protein